MRAKRPSLRHLHGKNGVITRHSEWRGNGGSLFLRAGLRRPGARALRADGHGWDPPPRAARRKGGPRPGSAQTLPWPSRHLSSLTHSCTHMHTHVPHACTCMSHTTYTRACTTHLTHTCMHHTHQHVCVHHTHATCAHAAHAHSQTRTFAQSHRAPGRRYQTRILAGVSASHGFDKGSQAEEGAGRGKGKLRWP